MNQKTSIHTWALHVALITILFWGILGIGLAQAECEQEVRKGYFTNPICANDLPELVKEIVDLVALVALPVAVVAIIYSGFLFVTARGNDTQLGKAKQTFYWTILGVGVIVGADAIARAVVEFAREL